MSDIIGRISPEHRQLVGGAALSLVVAQEAHRTCPYSKALKAGVDITVTLV